jgi:hypothetical protein
MTARAYRLTDGAKTSDTPASFGPPYPASSARVFVNALERLDYRMAPLLADAGIHRADLDDPGVGCSAERWNSAR